MEDVIGESGTAKGAQGSRREGVLMCEEGVLTWEEGDLSCWEKGVVLTLDGVVEVGVVMGEGDATATATAAACGASAAAGAERFPGGRSSRDGALSETRLHTPSSPPVSSPSSRPFLSPLVLLTTVPVFLSSCADQTHGMEDGLRFMPDVGENADAPLPAASNSACAHFEAPHTPSRETRGRTEKRKHIGWEGGRAQGGGVTKRPLGVRNDCHHHNH